MRYVRLAIIPVFFFAGLAASGGSLSIGSYQIVDSQRVTLTQWNVAYNAVLLNSGPALSAVSATVKSLDPTNIQVVDGQDTLTFSPVPANSPAASQNTFTILVNRSIPFDPSKLQWTFQTSGPVANAGTNQTVHLGSTVTLNGAGSINSGGGQLTFAWQFVSVPPGSTAALSNPTSVSPSFLADFPGTYLVSLTVSNGTASSSATVQISTADTPPVANAGPAQTASVGSKVVLNGGNSYDVDGDALTYAWAFASVPQGSVAALSGTSTVSPSFTVDKPGTYLVQLVVSDTKGGTGAATVSISTQNSPPVANVGPSQVAKIGATVQLNGTGSTDADGDALTYKWSLITVPSGSAAVLSSSTAISPSFVADKGGTYTAQLIVNDGKADSAPATVAISTGIVLAPTANAGLDQAAAVNSSVNLKGSGADPQSLPLTYHWSFASKPAGSTATFSNPGVSNPSFVVDRAGTYEAQLIVSNGTLNSVPSVVTITTANTQPVAFPGADRNVRVGDTVHLDGSNSFDADGDALTYAWAFIYRPPGSTAVLSGATTAAPSFIPDIPGSYLVQLIVSDGVTPSVPVVVRINAVSSISLTPNPLTMGLSGTATLTVTLPTAAGPGGQTIGLASNNPAVATVPSSVIVPEGDTTASFKVTPLSTGTAGIVATAAGYLPGTASVVVVTPAIGITLAANIGLDRTVNGTLTLNVPAPDGGTQVSLSASKSGIVDIVPATVSIAAGTTTGTFSVTGSTVGTTVITASSQGFAGGTANVNVSNLGQITLPSQLTIAPNQSVAYPVTLVTPAPTGGVTVTLSIADSSKVTLSTTAVAIAAGATTPATQPQITGVTFGTTTITASAPGFMGDTGTVTVAATLSFSPNNLTLGQGATHDVTLNLSGAAPSPSGLTVNLSSSNTSVAKVPASVLIPAKATSVPVTITTTSAGSATIHASAAGVPDTTATVTVVNLGALNLPTTFSIGLGQTESLSVSLPSVSPTPVTVNLASSDTSKAKINPASITIPAGSKTPPTQPQLTGVNVGNVAITASASGYVSATSAVSVTATLTFSPTTISIQPGNTQTVKLTMSAAPPAPVTVNLKSSNTAAATVPAAAIIPANGTSVDVPITAVAAGAATITASAAGLTTAATSITVTALPLTITTASLPNGQTGVSYSQQLAVKGGTAPFTWVLTSGTLPSGLSFSPSGLISGKPNSAANATPLTFKVTDSGSPAQSASVSLTLTITGPAAASIGAFGGAEQTAPINTAFSILLVAQVKDSGGRPVAGASVTFSAPSTGASGTFAGGGNSTTVNTNASGLATAPVFTANSKVGSYSISASVAGVSTPATFGMTNRPGTPSSIVATSGTPQRAPLDTAFGNPLVVTVKDAGGNPVGGVTVTFTAPSTGASGTFAGGANTAHTNASGVATSAIFTANGTVGTYNVTASVANLSAIASFSLTNGKGHATITVISGNAQSASINTTFANPLVVSVKDAGGSPVKGATVTFTAPSSGAGGTFAGGINTAVTNSSGIATSAAFTANGTAGSYAVTASAAGATGTAAFSLTNTSPVAKTITIVGGSGQSGPINTAFASRLAVVVKDASGNPVNGLTVTFTAPSGGASGTFAGGANTAITNASGTATSAIFTANKTAGTYAVVASVGALSTNFTLTNQHGPAVSIKATGGTPQSAFAGTAFGSPLSATVTDAGGNLVAGATVTFTVVPKNGASGTFAGGNNTAVTNASGVATSAVFTANNTAGNYTVNATVPGVGTPAMFSLTNTSRKPASITATSGSGQSAKIATAFAHPLVATVKDATGVPVPGVTVTFTVVPSNGAGGSFAAGVNTAVTNGFGIATAPTFTANSTAGSYNVNATVSGVSSPAQFSLTNTPGAASSIAVSGGSGQKARIKTAFASPLSVVVKDAGGNLVSGVTVTFAAPSTGASATFAGGNTAVTNASGVATSSTLTANNTVGSYTINASVVGISGTAPFPLTNTPGPVASIKASAGDSQSARINTAFGSPLVALVQDAGSNPVSGVTVTFTINAGSNGAAGSFAGNASTAVTDASGKATSAVLTANSKAGAYTVTASVAGFTAKFSLTNTPGLAASVAINSGSSQTAQILTTFAGSLSAIVKDSGGNPVSGVTVTFTAPSTGASGTFAGGNNKAITNASGIATSAAFTANSTAGTYTVAASISGVSAAAKFSLTNKPGPPTSITPTGGTPQSANINSAFSSPLTAFVKDAGGNGVSGVTVTFTAPSSGATGTFAGNNTAVTNASGFATSATFAANGNTGSYTVDATAPGISSPAHFQLTNTSVGGGSLSVGKVAVGKDLRAPLTIVISPVPGSGGLQLSLSSSDAGKALISLNAVDKGAATQSVKVDPGSSTFTVFIDGLASSGTATITAKASGYGDGNGTVTLAPSGFVIAGPSGIGVPSFPINQGTSQTITVSLARLDSSFHFVAVQPLRAGVSASVNVTSSNTSVGTILTSPLTFNGGDSSATTQFKAVNTGSTTITASAPAGFNTPAAGADSVTATVNPVAMNADDASVGQNLETTVEVHLVGVAPAGGLTVNITSNDSGKMLLSTSPTTAGQASIKLGIPAGLNHTADFYVQGLANTGTVTYTASAGSGFGSANGTVTLTKSGVVIAGPGGLGVNSFQTTSGGFNTPLNIYSAQLDASGNVLGAQQLRGGESISVNVTSSNTSVGTITKSPVAIVAGDFNAITAFHPQGNGTANISVNVPAGFSTPAQDTTVTATVSTPAIAPSSRSIGNNLEAPGTVVIGQAAPAGGLVVTLKSSNAAALKFAANPTDQGQGTLPITVPAGKSSATFYLQGFGSSGNVTYTASATGYSTGTGTVTLTPSAVLLSGPFGVAFPFPVSTTTSSAPTTLTLFVVQTDASGNIVDMTTQTLAGGLSVTSALSNSSSATGTVSPTSVTISGGSQSATAKFTPKAVGSTTVTVVPPAAYDGAPATDKMVNINVTK